ncbi:hypothetical protein GCM10028824_06120 [Hymenobacter segetis]|uniref:Uncharacterized protein n=1 Tax=Hymenobacter segetis TaxID=2025509 RepID=A0ABU9LXX0_9BACT
MIHVMVVPETEEFKDFVKHDDLIFINLNLGVPNFAGWQARYAAPYWISGERGVKRIYHIKSVTNDGQSTVLALGNSFVLDEAWDEMEQARRFAYFPLKNFGFVEVQEGVLMKYKV